MNVSGAWQCARSVVQDVQVSNHATEDSAAIRHVVQIRLEPDLDPERRHALEADLQALVAARPYASHGSLHRDLGRRPNSTVSATWMVCLDFPSMAAFEAYLLDPIHVSFLSDHQPSMAWITAIQVPAEDSENLR